MSQNNYLQTNNLLINKNNLFKNTIKKMSQMGQLPKDEYKLIFRQIKV